MSTVHLSEVSHTETEKFRILHDDALKILGPDALLPINMELQAISSTSQVTMIGAGFAGLNSSLVCKNEWKIDDFVVFDKHYNWGGTWWANTYPGCASDVPACWDSFFSELSDNWSDLRAPQYEIEEYILEVVKKNDLDKHARFGTAVYRMEWNDDEGLWIILASDVKSGQRYEHKTKIILSCQGGLVNPIHLSTPGLNKFQGDYMHSALWNHDVDFKDKNVLVVGNGCSAIQVIPALMDDLEVNSVTQVFRSKHSVLPPLLKFAFTVYKAFSGTRVGLVFVRWIIASVAESKYPLYQGDSYLSRFLRWCVNRVHELHEVGPREIS